PSTRTTRAMCSSTSPSRRRPRSPSSRPDHPRRCRQAAVIGNPLETPASAGVFTSTALFLFRSNESGKKRGPHVPVFPRRRILHGGLRRLRPTARTRSTATSRPCVCRLESLGTGRDVDGGELRGLSRHIRQARPGLL